MKKATIVIIVVVLLVIIFAVLSFMVMVWNSARSTVSTASSSMDSLSIGMSSSSYIGYSTGGAKDIANFRENIKNGYFPISTDVTYNGLFYDYMFDTGVDDSKRTGNEGLFFPSYSTAVSNDPVSQKPEYYMTVGLNSNIKEEDFQRKKLNLLVLLDISGSMGSPFYSYYYDNPVENEKYDRRSKMNLANEAVCTLIDQLNEDDKFGLVTFDDSASVFQKIKQVSKLDISNLKNKIKKIADNGGTNFSSGYVQATSEFSKFIKDSKDEYENRIIVVTDAMPNYGMTGSNDLMTMVKNNATTGIYTTFIGVGVDFNTKLIEEITDVKGANYYSVHNSKEFEERMGEGFEYMVTPLVFDLSLDVDSEDFEVTAIYGSDTANAKTGNIMNVNTLFPSKSEGGEVKGGIVLVKLKAKDASKQGNLQVKVSYQDRNGKDHKNAQTVTFRDTNEEYYENTGIRKGILLTRYVNAMKNWILYERSEHREKRFYITPVTGICDCIILPPEVVVILGEHERTSVKLSVSDEYKEIFRNLKSYIEAENKEIKDDTLKQEIEIIDLLLEA